MTTIIHIEIETIANGVISKDISHNPVDNLVPSKPTYYPTEKAALEHLVKVIQDKIEKMG